MTEEELRVMTLVEEFLSNEGPHRTYEKAYRQMFDQILSLPGWRSKK